jgi:ATP-binding cassette subfamily A (ABC1) protein 3
MDEFRKNLGICPQHDVLFDRLTQKEHLDLFAVYKGIPAEKRAEEVEKIMEEMGIKEKENCLVEGLSGGQKRKLSIAIALLGGSKIVFLDEPSSGMDITSRRQLWDILKKSCSNKIIVLTTHYMEEASVLGNRIGIVSNGVLKCSGTSLFLIDKFGKYISLTIAKEKEANDDNIINFIQERIQNIEYEVLNEEILFKIPKRDYVNLKEFFNELDQNLANLNIKSYGASLPTLEDVFLNVSADLHTSKISLI